MKIIQITVVLTVFFHVCFAQKKKQPNILFILADDYGFSDVGFHGSKIKTPNIDELANDGIRLEKYYVQPICSPTRSQLMSGLYQIHTGLQHFVIWPTQANGLPLNITTLPEKLKEVGYATHMVGKWHLGYYKKEYMPHRRGFDTFYGFLNGCEDFYKKTYCWRRYCGYDFRYNDVVLWHATEYSTHLYARRVEGIIKNHVANTPEKPWFIYLPLQAPHEPMQSPASYQKPYSFIKDGTRRIYAGMVAAMDEAIGNITRVLKEKGLWENTVIIFSTDNGGQVHKGGFNWPLRGWKISMWEGGIRAVGFISSPLLQRKGIQSNQMMHVSDWFPTLVNLAGGNTDGMNLDGFDMWQALNDGSDSPREEILHGIDPLWQLRGSPRENASFNTQVRSALRTGKWKLITGQPGNGSWVPPPEESDSKGILDTSRNEQNVWLFDMDLDPNENRDLSDQYPEIVDSMLKRLAEYQSTAVPARYPPDDPLSNPALRGGAYGPWQLSSGGMTLRSIYSHFPLAFWIFSIFRL